MFLFFPWIGCWGWGLEKFETKVKYCSRYRVASTTLMVNIYQTQTYTSYTDSIFSRYSVARTTLLDYW